VNPDILTCGNFPQLNISPKPPIPYYPDWKLKKALENNLLLHRIFDSKISYEDKVLTLRYPIKVRAADISRGEGLPRDEFHDILLFEVNRTVKFKRMGQTFEMIGVDSYLTMEELDTIFNGASEHYYALFKDEFDIMKNGNP